MADLNRHTVLQGIGAGIVGTALIEPAQAQRRAKRKLGYPIVGLGSYATRQIMPQFKKCGYVRLVAPVGNTPEKLERYGAQDGVPDTHRYSIVSRLSFPSSVIANCVSSYSSEHNANRVTGTKRGVGMDPATCCEEQKLSTRAGGEIEQVSVPTPIPLRALSEDGLRDMRLIEAIYRSARERRAVSLV